MNIKQIKADARKKINENLKMIIIITSFYYFLILILNRLQNVNNQTLKLFFTLVSIIFEIPLGYGLTSCLWRIYKGKKANIKILFDDTKNNIQKSWGIAIRIFIRCIIPVMFMILAIVLIVVSFVLGYTAIFNPEIMINSSLNINFTLSLGMKILMVFLFFFGILLYIIAMEFLFKILYDYAIANILSIDKNMTADKAIFNSKKKMLGNKRKLFILQFTVLGWLIISILTLGIGLILFTPYVKFITFVFYEREVI